MTKLINTISDIVPIRKETKPSKFKRVELAGYGRQLREEKRWLKAIADGKETFEAGIPLVPGELSPRERESRF